MIHTKPITVCVAGIVALAIYPIVAVAASKTTSLQLTYQVEWGDVDVATTTADWIFGEDTFELVATSRTIGVTDRLRRYRGRT